MFSAFRISVGLCLLAILSRTAPGQEIPNESYKSWSQFKVGTTATLQTTTKMNGRALSQIKMIQKLVEKNDKEVVIEISTIVVANGMEFKTKSNKVTHKRNVKSSLTKPADVPNLKFVETGKGKESIKVGGKTYACNWISTSSNFGGVKTESKVWMSDKVPGMMVKTMVKTSSGIETTSELTNVTQ